MDKESVRSRVGGILRAPSSKSYAQRAIAAALLTEGKTVLRNMGLCDDTQAALEVATALGARSERTVDGNLIIYGAPNGFEPAAGLNVGESGLSARMFIPIAALSGNEITIDGSGTLLSRPFGTLAGPLRALGVQVEMTGGDYIPVTVKGPMKGGTVRVEGSLSSQFVTGLLMSLPLIDGDTTLLVNDPVSTPYLDMTLDLLKVFGIEVSHNYNHTEFFIKGGQSYISPEGFYNIEGDWSGASCLLVAGAIAGEVTVANLNPLSLQADIAVIDALSRAGAGITTDSDSVTVSKRKLNAFTFDATHSPDLFPALVALAAACEGVSAIRGVRRLIAKESNRARALADVYGRMGIDVGIDDDTMHVAGGRVKSAEVDSWGDHRIAMSAAVAGLVSDGSVTVRDAGVVAKSYPGFWDDLAGIMIK